MQKSVTSLRLSPLVIEAMVSLFEQIFAKGELYVFGSRADADQMGGDIDLLIAPENLQDIAVKKIHFLAALKRLIGEQKIDLVIDRGQNRLIDKIARQQGVLVCQIH